MEALVVSFTLLSVVTTGADFAFNAARLSTDDDNSSSCSVWLVGIDL